MFSIKTLCLQIANAIKTSHNRGFFTKKRKRLFKVRKSRLAVKKNNTAKPDEPVETDKESSEVSAETRDQDDSPAKKRKIGKN